MEMVGGVPWMPSPESGAGEEAMPAVEIPMEIESPEIERPASDDREFVPRRLYIKSRDIEKYGVTPGCKGCVAVLRGGRGVPHSEACRMRLIEQISQSDEGRARKEAAEQRQNEYFAKMMEQADKRRKVSGREQEGREPAGVKRGRGDDELEEGGSEAPAKRRAEGETDQDMETGMIDKWEYMQVACEEHELEHDGWVETSQGEKWHEYIDSRTGEVLDAEKVRAAREEEIGELERRVYVMTDVAECWAKTGKGPIDVRWVDVHKGEGVHRSRLVAKDFRPKSKIGDIEGLFAATPPLELVKLLFAHAAAKGRGGTPRKVMLIDVSKAHLYAPVEGDVYVELPPERKVEGKCAKLLYTLYGMRKAASGWEREYSKTLEEDGFVAGRANVVTFYHPARDIRIVVHGDDFVIEGEETDLKWVESIMRAKYPLKMRGILGPEDRDAKEVKVLNRTVRWVGGEITFEADKKHVQKMLEDMSMENCNASVVPGIKEKPVEEDEEELTASEARVFRSVVARANYLAQDRPDVRYSCKELCRAMSRPCVGAWRALKKLCRYLKGNPAIVQSVPIGIGSCHQLDVFVDSDWAGCASTRKSTNGGAVMWNGVCLKTWSTTQTVVALSSGEAEYYASVKRCAGGLAIQSFCRDLGIDVNVQIWTDSEACRGICNRTGLGKIKHMDVQLLWLQDAVRRERVKLGRVRGDKNAADLMTKHVSRVVIEKHLGRLGFTRR